MRSKVRRRVVGNFSSDFGRKKDDSTSDNIETDYSSVGDLHE